MKLYRRENYLSKLRGFYHDTGIIKVISGVRRCGKSCLMHTIAEELAEYGIPVDNITFIDRNDSMTIFLNYSGSRYNADNAGKFAGLVIKYLCRGKVSENLFYEDTVRTEYVMYEQIWDNLLI